MSVFVLDAVAEANPIPGGPPSAVIGGAELLAVIDGEVLGGTRAVPLEPVRPRRRAWAVAVAAGIAAISMVGAVAMFSRSASSPAPSAPVGTSPPETVVPPQASTTTLPPVPTSEERAAIDFVVAAHDAQDVDAILDLLMLPADKEQVIRLQLELQFAMGGEIALGACGRSLSGDPRCELTYTDDLLEALGVVPLDGVLRLSLDGDGATSWYFYTGNIATLAGARAPFFDWLETAHAEELLVMSNGSGIPRASEQSAALWALRIPEYLDTLDG